MQKYDVAVIGAGVFGAWTAWHLGRAGKSVLLVDAWGAGHTRASSGDESRIIRMGYGADAIYTRMSMRSLELWRAHFPQFFFRTGVLWIARENNPYSLATERTLFELGVPHEILPPDALARRYPQMRLENAYAIFEPESGALLARRAVAAVVEDGGVDFSLEMVRPPGDARAEVFVFACGAWLPKLFPDLLGNRIFPTRQEVYYFAPPAGDSLFAPPQFPAWVDFSDPRSSYGIPNIENRGFKVAFDRHGPAIDPDTADRRISEAGVEEMRRFLAERFPALRDAPLAESRVCQYENSSNGDFLIDRHPDWPHIWMVGGGSGHGFKHGPAVGEYVVAQILGTSAPEPRFSLASKAQVQQRTVY
jgi:glycine/D-amino acid oxidase-like deaminating enzyme